MRGATYGACLVFLLLLPAALAASAQGTFLAHGAVTVPAGSELAGRPYTAFSHTGPGVRLVAHIPEVHVLDVTVDEAWAGQVGVPLAAVTLDRTERSYRLTNLTLDLVPGEHEGWIGLEPGPSSQGAFTTMSQLDVERSDHTEVGSRRPVREDGPEDVWFWATVSEPHLLVQANGTLDFRGPGALKIFGPDLILRADENETRAWTGDERVSATESQRRWLHLAFDEARVEFSTGAAPLTLALAESTLSWEGRAFLASASGSLRTGQGEWVVDRPQPVQLHGAFTARLVPIPQQDRLGTLVEAAGDLRDGAAVSASAVHRAPVASPAGLPPLLWLPLAFGLVVAGGAAGGFAAHRRARRASPRALGFSADDCLGFALRHAEDAQWGRALEWAQRARKLAPASARAWQLEGWALVNLGFFEDAIEAYEGAFRIAPDGAGAYEVARVVAQAGRAQEDAERWLAQALRLEPALVEELLDDHAFQALAQRPAYERMVDEALARLSGADGVAR